MAQKWDEITLLNVIRLVLLFFREGQQDAGCHSPVTHLSVQPVNILVGRLSSRRRHCQQSREGNCDTFDYPTISSIEPLY